MPIAVSVAPAATRAASRRGSFTFGPFLPVVLRPSVAAPRRPASRSCAVRSRATLDMRSRAVREIVPCFITHPCIGQLAIDYALTGSLGFAREADVLYADYALREAGGTVLFTAGSHTGYRFGSTGQVPAANTIDPVRATSAPDNGCDKVMNRLSIWYNISAGSLAGSPCSATRSRPRSGRPEQPCQNGTLVRGGSCARRRRCRAPGGPGTCRCRPIEGLGSCLSPGRRQRAWSASQPRSVDPSSEPDEPSDGGRPCLPVPERIA